MILRLFLYFVNINLGFWRMIKDIILVGIGSGIGGICRYLISLAMNHGVNGFHNYFLQ